MMLNAMAPQPHRRAKPGAGANNSLILESTNSTSSSSPAADMSSASSSSSSSAASPATTATISNKPSSSSKDSAGHNEEAKQTDHQASMTATTAGNENSHNNINNNNDNSLTSKHQVDTATTAATTTTTTTTSVKLSAQNTAISSPNSSQFDRPTHHQHHNSHNHSSHHNLNGNHHHNHNHNHNHNHHQHHNFHNNSYQSQRFNNRNTSGHHNSTNSNSNIAMNTAPTNATSSTNHSHHNHNHNHHSHHQQQSDPGDAIVPPTSAIQPASGLVAPSPPITASTNGRRQQQHAPSGPPHYVDLHVNAGECVALQLIDGQEQVVAGPATITMISQQQSPPVPIPVQAPPGHMIHQIADENGTLKHIILSVMETDESAPLDSTVITLPQGTFRINSRGQLVSTTYDRSEAHLTTLPQQAYFANYDGCPVASVSQDTLIAGSEPQNSPNVGHHPYGNHYINSNNNHHHHHHHHHPGHQQSYNSVISGQTNRTNSNTHGHHGYHHQPNVGHTSSFKSQPLLPSGHQGLDPVISAPYTPVYSAYNSVPAPSSVAVVSSSKTKQQHHQQGHYGGGGSSQSQASNYRNSSEPVEGYSQQRTIRDHSVNRASSNNYSSGATNGPAEQTRSRQAAIGIESQATKETGRSESLNRANKSKKTTVTSGKLNSPKEVPKQQAVTAQEMPRKRLHPTSTTVDDSNQAEPSVAKTTLVQQPSPDDDAVPIRATKPAIVIEPQATKETGRSESLNRANKSKTTTVTPGKPSSPKTIPKQQSVTTQEVPRKRLHPATTTVGDSNQAEPPVAKTSSAQKSSPDDDVVLIVSRADSPSASSCSRNKPSISVTMRTSFSENNLKSFEASATSSTAKSTQTTPQKGIPESQQQAAAVVQPKSSYHGAEPAATNRRRAEKTRRGSNVKSSGDQQQSVAKSASQTASQARIASPSHSASSNIATIVSSAGQQVQSKQRGHGGGSSASSKSSATMQPIRVSSLIKQYRVRISSVFGNIVQNTLSSYSDTKFAGLLLVLFTIFAMLLAMFIHFYIVAPVTE